VKKEPFEDLDEARLIAGFFVSEICEKIGITSSTWYRWKKAGKAPRWAFVTVTILSGQLDLFGWDGWYIENGTLYTRKHHPDHYHWKPGELLEARFWQINQTSAQAAWRDKRRLIGARPAGGAWATSGRRENQQSGADNGSNGPETA